MILYHTMNFPRFFGLFLLGPVLALGLSCSPRLPEIPGPKTQPNIVFVSTRRGTTEIFTMNADGSNPKQLTGTRGFEAHPAWSPDRSQILFTRYEEISGLTELLVMEPDGSEPRILHKGEKNLSNPEWSPDGSKIAFQTGTGLFLMDYKSAQSILLYPKGRKPSWSPDGEDIVFEAPVYKEGILSGVAIFSFRLHSRRVLRLTQGPGQHEVPVFSPDGGSIAFAGNFEGSFNIYRMQANGHNVTRLTNHEATDYFPRWSADGTRIVFVSERDGNREIYVMFQDGTQPTRLTRNRADDMAPFWSQDGSWVIFSRIYPQNYADIYRVAVDGSRLMNLTGATKTDFQPHW